MVLANLREQQNTVVECEIHLTEARFIGDGAEGWPFLPEVQVDGFFVALRLYQMHSDLSKLTFFFLSHLPSKSDIHFKLST